NRGGNRQANNALWTIATNRLRHHPETRAYAERRTREGRSRKEIVRCLMRHLARRLYPLLLTDLTPLAAGSCLPSTSVLESPSPCPIEPTSLPLT
ncbi:MAG TPA: hypothetical protein VK988_13665, partial [Acidimicrobiales bacterium]|nr:hypothetical protein [Acidimicrobiales bacterium]